MTSGVATGFAAPYVPPSTQHSHWYHGVQHALSSSTTALRHSGYTSRAPAVPLGSSMLMSRSPHLLPGSGIATASPLRYEGSGGAVSGLQVVGYPPQLPQPAAPLQQPQSAVVRSRESRRRSSSGGVVDGDSAAGGDTVHGTGDERGGADATAGDASTGRSDRRVSPSTQQKVQLEDLQAQFQQLQQLLLQQQAHVHEQQQRQQQSHPPPRREQDNGSRDARSVSRSQSPAAASVDGRAPRRDPDQRRASATAPVMSPVVDLATPSPGRRTHHSQAHDQPHHQPHHLRVDHASKRDAGERDNHARAMSRPQSQQQPATEQERVRGGGRAAHRHRSPSPLVKFLHDHGLDSDGDGDSAVALDDEVR